MSVQEKMVRRSWHNGLGVLPSCHMAQWSGSTSRVFVNIAACGNSSMTSLIS